MTTIGTPLSSPKGTMWYLFDLTPSGKSALVFISIFLRDQASYWLERLQAGSIYTWDDLTTRFLAQFFPPGRTTKLCNDILMFQQHQAQYEDEGWNDPVIPEEGGLNYENPDIEQLLTVVEYKVDMLMKDAISLIGRSEGVFGMTRTQIAINRPLEPSRQEGILEHIKLLHKGQSSPFDHEQKSQEHKRTIIHPQEVSLEEKVRRFGVFENGVHQMHHDALTRRPIHFGDVIDWEFLAHQNLDQAFFESINTDPFSGPQWANLFRVNEPIYRELIGGEQQEMSLLELGWRIGLYTERKSRENATLSGLSRAETVKEIRLLMEFWPSIRDGGFNVGNTKVASIRDPKIARTFGLLTNEMRDVLSVAPLPHVFKKKSLIAMGIIMELHNGVCVWPMTQTVEEGDEAEEEAGGEAANEGAGDERWEQFDAWRGQQEAQTNWMYNHTVREFQYLSTRGNLDPHIQIDPFPGREADYRPYGYRGYMPPGYVYRPDPSRDGSS
ncbi:zinc finger, CCHC-type containing protein [Tanacetum coccineum]